MPALKRSFRRVLTVLDAVLTRLYGWERNPIHQAGTVANAMLLVLLGTGLYLVLYYRVGSPADSVARMACDPNSCRSEAISYQGRPRLRKRW